MKKLNDGRISKPRPGGQKVGKFATVQKGDNLWKKDKTRIRRRWTLQTNFDCLTDILYRNHECIVKIFFTFSVAIPTTSLFQTVTNVVPQK